MSSGKNKSKQVTSTNSTTRNYDQRSTETINAGIGGDIADANVISGNKGTVNLTATDGGAFDMVENVLLELGGAMFEQQAETLGAANALSERSLDAAMNLKSGETVADPINRNLAYITKTAAIVAGVGGVTYLGVTAMNKRGKK